MKITNKRIRKNPDGLSIELLVERENGKYNNVMLTVQLNHSEIEGCTKDQVVTKAWHREKWRAIQIFDRVWECRADEDAEETAISPADEVDNPINFKVVELPAVEVPPTVKPPAPYISDDQKAIDLMKCLMQSDEFLLLVGIQPRPPEPQPGVIL